MGRKPRQIGLNPQKCTSTFSSAGLTCGSIDIYTKEVPFFFSSFLFCCCCNIGLLFTSEEKKRLTCFATHSGLHVTDTDYWVHVVASTHSRVFLTSKHHLPEAGTKTEQKPCCMSAFSHHFHWYSLSCFSFSLKNSPIYLLTIKETKTMPQIIYQFSELN